MYQVKDTEIAMFDFELGGKTYSVPLLRHMPLKKLLE